MNAIGGGKYSCARSYGYNYRARLPFLSSPALVMGRAFDELVNAFFEWRMGGTPLAEAVRLVSDAAPACWVNALVDAGLQMDDKPLADYQAALLRAFDAFIIYTGDTVPFSVQEKHVLIVRNGDHVIESVGYSDRIDPDGVIVDHKLTGTKRWNADGDWDMDWVEQRRDQGVLYWLSRLAAAKRVIVGGEEHPPMPPVVPVFRLIVTHTRKGAKSAEVRHIDLRFNRLDQERVLSRMREADAVKQSGVYPARPGAACAVCSYCDRCRDDFSAGVDPFVGAA